MNSDSREEFVSLFDVFSGEFDNKKIRVIKDELAEIKGVLKVAMDSGLAPDEMKSAAVLYIASQSAIYIIDSL